MQQNICSAAGVWYRQVSQLQADWLMLDGALSVHIHMSLSLKHVSLEDLGPCLVTPVYMVTVHRNKGTLQGFAVSVLNITSSLQKSNCCSLTVQSWLWRSHRTLTLKINECAVLRDKYLSIFHSIIFGRGPDNGYLFKIRLYYNQ